MLKRVRISLLITLFATQAFAAYGQSLMSGGSAEHTLGIRSDGTVAAWGQNSTGQVSGAGSVANATSVSAGVLHSLALRSNGTVAAWGDNSYGQLSGAPAVTGAVSVSAGHSHSLALRSNGTVAAWGNNSYGQVSGMTSVTGATAISAGYLHSLALRSNGTVVASGWNAYGQVSGAGSVSGATAVSAGAFHSLALRNNGTVAAWGNDNAGQVSGASGVSNAVAIAGGGEFSLALRSNGTVAGWGANNYGQLGVVGASNVVYVTAGWGHSYAVQRDGSIVSYGLSNSGQRSTPTGFALPTTVTWKSATSADYLTSHQWSGGIPSTALSTAVFDKAGTYSVGFGNSAEAKGLNVTAGNVTFNLGTHGYQVGSNGLQVGAGASLTVNGNQLTTSSISGTGSIVSNGFLFLNDANSSNLSNTISGSGTFSKVGAGTLTATTGSISTTNLGLQNGTLQLGTGNHIGDATNVIMNGGTLSLANGNTEKIGSLSGSSNSNVFLNSGTLETGGNNAGTTFAGVISGTGSLTKLGTGGMTLSGANTYTGATNINGGILTLGANNVLSNSTAVNVASGATFNVNGRADTIGSLNGSGNVTMGSGGQLSLSSNSNSVFSGTISGSGYIQKSGNGSLVLSGMNTFSGEFYVLGGTISGNTLGNIGVASAFGTSSDTGYIGFLGGSTFEYTGATTATNRNLSGDGANIRITEAGTNLTWNGAMEGFTQVNKLGAGTLTIGSSGGLQTQTLNVQGGELAVTANQGITSSAPGGLTDVTVQAAGTLSVTGVTQQLGDLTSTGSVQLDSGAQLGTATFTNGGILSVDGGSTLTSSSLHNSLGGNISVANGSTLAATTLQNDFGGSITLDSTSQLFASSLINNGEIFGNVDLAIAQTLSGTGTIYGMTTVDNGSVIAPGNSIGTMNLTDLTWGPGGIYDWEIANALGTPGTEWDFINLTGSLNITATSLNPFSINLFAFGGPVANFDASQNYSWSLLSANGGIFGFDSADFLLDPTGFSNPYTGTFSLSQSGNTLNLLYTGNTAAVPEPGSVLLLSVGTVIGAVRYRRRKQANEAGRKLPAV